MDGIHAMYRIESLISDSFKSSVKRVFQSVGLSPIVTPSDSEGVVVTYQGVKTPGTIRKETFRINEDEDTWEKEDSQTVGGISMDVNMRGKMDPNKDSNEESGDEEIEDEFDDESEDEGLEIVCDDQKWTV